MATTTTPCFQSSPKRRFKIIASAISVTYARGGKIREVMIVVSAPFPSKKMIVVTVVVKVVVVVVVVVVVEVVEIVVGWWLW